LVTSFISEHTAEFVLVPKMKAVLESRFSTVVPIFPWLSREFGRRGKTFYGFSEFFVLALFPRRPKISDQGDIFVTVNGELSAYKEIGLRYGISVMAGCPKAATLWELASCDTCVWLDVDSSYRYLENIDLLEGKILSDKDIVNSASQGKVHTMDTLEDFIRETRYVLPAGFFGARYKPVYFLIS